MSPRVWEQVEKIYSSALAYEPGQRSAFLAEACAGDEELRSTVESLLAADQQAGSFLDPSQLEAQLRDLAAQTELLEGQTFGNYRVHSRIGSGGMGDVYLAEDTSLDRKLALKVLAVRGVPDLSRQLRFVREAKAASALNHPNIITVYQIGSIGGAQYIATEFVEGETVRQKLSGGRLDATQALAIARQATAALGAAHLAGIVHRDVKPENIMIRPDGLVKILDFGLARIAGGQLPPAGKSDVLSGRPLPHGRGSETDAPGSDQSRDREGAVTNLFLTSEGAVVGTPQYMSPEQASGQRVDARTDIFSLGCVLYEMLAGQPAFPAKTTDEAIAAILHSEPTPLSKVLPGATAEMERALQKSMAKDPGRRYQSMAELAQGLDAIEASLRSPAVPRRRLWIIAGMAILMAAAATALYSGGGRIFRSNLPPPTTTPLTSFPGNVDFAAFSPDGSRVVFSWDGNKPKRKNNRNIYIKAVGNGDPIQLTTSPFDERLPAWSPDGRLVAFERDPKPPLNELWVISVADGSERKIADCGVGLDWSADGKSIAFVAPYPPDGSGGIREYSMETGRTREITSGKPYAEGLVRYSPDGKRLAFQRGLSRSGRELFVVPRAGGAARRLTFDMLPIDGFAWTADSRELVFVSPRFGGPNLWRVPASGGTPERAPSMAHHPGLPAISRQGNRLAFTERFTDSNIWQYETPSLDKTSGLDEGSATSPEGKCLICSTFEDHSPEFTADGSRITFVSSRTGAEEIWVADRDGRHVTQLTSFSGPPTGTPRWSFDGRSIAFDSRAAGSSDIYVIGAQGGTPRRLTAELSTETVPAWSHDGKWLYFCSDRSGHEQIWKMPSNGGQPRQVTFGGGREAWESTDGKLLYFVRSQVLPGIWTVPVDGGPEQVVPELSRVLVSRSLAVVSDGIYYVEYNGGPRPKIRFFNFQTHRSRVLFTMDRQIVMNTLGLSISPDRRSVLLATVDHRVDDLMLIDHFR